MSSCLWSRYLATDIPESIVSICLKILTVNDRVAVHRPKSIKIDNNHLHNYLLLISQTLSRENRAMRESQVSFLADYSTIMKTHLIDLGQSYLNTHVLDHYHATYNTAG